MSKILDIALKDMLHSLRSLFAVAMMLVVPLLITGLLYLAFGRTPGSTTSAQIATTQVVVANLDQPPQGANLAVGLQLVSLLNSSALSNLIQVAQVSTEADARQAVDTQKAGVAIIIPKNLTGTIISTGQTAQITLYQDPTLTVGPLIVRQVVSQFVDGFVGASIGISTITQQYSQHGAEVSNAAIQDFISQFTDWARTNAQSSSPLTLDVQPLTAPTSRQSNNSFAGSIMIGMMIFFIFFTGAEEAQSIVREDEHKTLARLFSTPTPRSFILAGKILSIFLILAVQITVLLVLSSMIFKINWGLFPSILLVSLGTIASAGGFGLFIMSLIKTTRQGGPVLGAVLTLTGVAGGTITTGFQNMPAFYNTLTLMTPQGWALNAWKACLAGNGPAQVILQVAVLFGIGLVFFIIGAFIFRRRYA